MSDEETLLEFPCDFSIKAMGLATADFDLLVAEIVRNHAPDLGEGAVKSRPSKGGKYLAVTVTITATSKKQLDCIYQDLTDHELILMSL
jgi:putative lipoic acid-binding regulatory protein